MTITELGATNHAQMSRTQYNYIARLLLRKQRRLASTAAAADAAAAPEPGAGPAAGASAGRRVLEPADLNKPSYEHNLSKPSLLRPPPHGRRVSVTS